MPTEMRALPKDLACIACERWNLRLIVPIRTAQERHVMFAHVLHVVRMNRRAQVALDGKVWWVFLGRGGCCARCGRSLSTIRATGLRNGSVLCGTCALLGLESPEPLATANRLPLHRQPRAGVPDLRVRAGAPVPQVGRHADPRSDK